jgi:hypothetical protein
MRISVISAVRTHGNQRCPSLVREDMTKQQLYHVLVHCLVLLTFRRSQKLQKQHRIDCVGNKRKLTANCGLRYASSVQKIQEITR